MAVHIGEYILGGYLSNKKRHGVHGWLAFSEDRGLRIELIGDMAGDLAGRTIEFEVPDREPASDDVLQPLLKDLAIPQIGAAGEMLFRIARVPTCPPAELMSHAHAGERLRIEERPCLYLEWFSQNGRVVAEIEGVEVRDRVDERDSGEEVTPTPLPDENEVGLGITGVSLDEFGNAREWNVDLDDEEEDDPYGLFPENLDEELSSAGQDIETEEASSEEPKRERTWHDVPGIDPETADLYEQWDEIYGGRKNELLSNLLDPPLQLPSPDEVTDEETARSYVLQIAASLARLSVAFELCKHFTMVRTYRWLVEEILTEGDVHPSQGAHGIVTHYSTWEFCPECDAEFDAEYEQRRKCE